MSSPSAPTSNPPETEAICACRKEARPACAGDAIYEHESKKYCVMHYPSKDKAKEFWNELEKKIDAEDYNFRGVYFPEGISFSGYKKTNEERFCFTKDANFDSATFNGEADFSGVMFNGEASFAFATFSNLAAFGFVIFSGAVDFKFAVFNGFTLFRATQFKKEVCFFTAQFKDYVKFWREQKDEEMFGEEASLTFDSLRIDKPERLSFRSVNLRPHWFINTDPRKFEFVDVRWDDDLAKERHASKSDCLLSIAYRQLAVNAEDNSRYDEAMKFRAHSMEASLLSLEQTWRDDWGKTCRKGSSFEVFIWWGYKAIRKLFSLTWWYRTLSYYGESPARAAIILLLILFLFCVPYLFVGFAPTKFLDQDKIGMPIRASSKSEDKAKEFLSEFSDQSKSDAPNDAPSKSENKVPQLLSDVAAAFVYSVETASLQKPEPRPTTMLARFFVGLETILAPLQAALLALAIRRKYMR